MELVSKTCDEKRKREQLTRLLEIKKNCLEECRAVDLAKDVVETREMWSNAGLWRSTTTKFVVILDQNLIEAQQGQGRTADGMMPTPPSTVLMRDEDSSKMMGTHQRLMRDGTTPAPSTTTDVIKGIM